MRREGIVRTWTGSALVLAALCAGCFGPRLAEQAPEERFGHRYETDPEGRRVVEITPPDTSRSYFYYPAVVDSVHVRPAPLSKAAREAGASGVVVEVLVEGAFPDACMVLHDLEQRRTVHFVDVRLTVRRPRGATCTSLRDPYRFYFFLEGLYDPGSYTLELNGEAYPFEVDVPE